MSDIIQSRFNRNTFAVFLVLLIIFLQSFLSEDVSVSETGSSKLGLSEKANNLAWTATKLVFMIPVLILWLLDWKRPLWKAIILSNAILTFDLIASTDLLVFHLTDRFYASQALLIKDTLLVMIINFLIFSLWYWIIDSPTLRQGTPRDNEAWDFLFPQRMSKIFYYQDWAPRYLDYLFLAFTTSFTFGPADTLPLSRRAKMLMIIQISISVINIVLLAGYALTLN